MDPNKLQSVGHYDVRMADDGTAKMELETPIHAQYVSFRVLSNGGQSRFTCLYRIRVLAPPQVAE